jgi:hypothetical protein
LDVASLAGARVVDLSLTVSEPHFVPSPASTWQDRSGIKREIECRSKT